MDRCKCLSRTLLSCVDGEAATQSADKRGGNTSKPEIQRAMMMHRNGVESKADRAQLRKYLLALKQTAEQQRLRWEARNEPVWVFVSSPECLHTGEKVMKWIVSVRCSATNRADFGLEATDSH